uniref:Uncharacterized protein n=1 Tax=Trichogramma kaykai TaxID=54128 RepID=A0ABD2WGG4_9HYME
MCVSAIKGEAICEKAALARHDARRRAVHEVFICKPCARELRARENVECTNGELLLLHRVYEKSSPNAHIHTRMIIIAVNPTKVKKVFFYHCRRVCAESEG